MTEDVTVTEKMTSRYHNTSSGGKQSTITTSAMEKKAVQGSKSDPSGFGFPKPVLGSQKPVLGLNPSNPSGKSNPASVRCPISV